MVVLDGELLYTKILKVDFFAFAYRLFHEDFSPINGALHDTQPFSSFDVNTDSLDRPGFESG